MTASDKQTAPTADGTNGSNHKPTDTAGVAGQQLLSFITRVERLNEEKKALQADISEVFKEAKSTGFDVATIRKVLKIRGMDEGDLQEQEALLSTYLHAIGVRR